MTREEAISWLKEFKWHEGEDVPIYETDIEAINMAIKALEQEPILEKLRAEITAKLEEEKFARSVFRHEEKDTIKAEQCTGSIMAYNNLIKLIDKYKAETEE